MAEIKIDAVICCGKTYDAFPKEVLEQNPIDLDIREDGKAAGVDETIKKLYDLIRSGKKFCVITVHETVLNVIGLLVEGKKLSRCGIQVKLYSPHRELIVETGYDNGGNLTNWPIGSLSGFDYYWDNDLEQQELF